MINLIPGKLYKLKEPTYIFATEECDEKVQRLNPYGTRYGIIGGSETQRDIIMMLKAYPRGGKDNRLCCCVLVYGIKGYILFGDNLSIDQIFQEIKL